MGQVTTRFPLLTAVETEFVMQTQDMLLTDPLVTMRRQSPTAKMNVKEESQMVKDAKASSSKSTGMGTRSVASTQVEWKVDSKFGADTSLVRFVSSQASLTILSNKVIALETN